MTYRLAFSPGYGKPTKHPEQDLVHRPVWNWAIHHRVGGTEREPVHLSDYLIHVPSGGKRGVVEAKILKGLGAPKGFPDLFLPMGRAWGPREVAPPPAPQMVGGWWNGAALELKVSGSYPDADQRRWLQRLTEQGYAAGWVDTPLAGIEFLRRYVAGELVVLDPLKRWKP